MKTCLTGLILCIIVKISVAQVSFTEISLGQSIFQTSSASGVSIADYDNDGDDDIFINADPSRLYRNNGDLTFTDVTLVSNLSLSSSVSVLFDANNDGWLDILASSYNSYSWYVNNRDGTFIDQTGMAGLSPISSQALMVGDVNGDQWLDVYCNNLNHRNQLFLNNGNGQFAEVAKAVGLDWESLAMGGLMLDYEDDGDLDIYVVFDGKRPCQMFINDGTGHFSNHSIELGLDHRSDAMGVDAADFDHDGVVDFYISNLYSNALLQKQNNGKYVDNAFAAGADDNGMGWGMFAFDYDNDTFSDIYVINTYPFNHYPNVLYHNEGDNTFSVVTEGSALEIAKNGIGGAFGDLDSDGRLDVVVANGSIDGVQVFSNEVLGGNWIEFTLVGAGANKFAVGSRVSVLVNGIIQFDEIAVGSGYKSQNSYTVHFGLADALVIDELTVRWPDGSVSNAAGLASNYRYLLVEGDDPVQFDGVIYIDELTSGTPEPPGGGIITSIPEANTSLFSVYPNPATVGGSINIQSFMLRQDCTLRITDVTGRVNREIVVPQSNMETYSVPVGDLGKGLYIISLLNGQGRITSKVIVKD